MPRLRGSEPISRLRAWDWRPRLSHNTASRFKTKTCIKQRALVAGIGKRTGLRPSIFSAEKTVAKLLCNFDRQLDVGRAA